MIPDASWPEHLPVPDREPTYRSSRLVEETIQDAITRLREAGIFPSSDVEADTITMVIGGDSAGRISPALVYVVWLQLLAWQGEYGHYGFADQILFALAILRQQPDIAARYRTFHHAIVVDEFQDMTPGPPNCSM